MKCLQKLFEEGIFIKMIFRTVFQSFCIEWHEFSPRLEDIQHALTFFSFYLFADSNELRNMHRNSLAAVNSHFITKNSTRVISQRGGLAILPCSVTMTQPATVSKYLYYFKILSKTTPQEIHCESDKSNRSSGCRKKETAEEN